MTAKASATIDDLYRVPEDGKAELVNGEIILMSPTGDLPSSAAGEIFASLREYSKRTGSGRAYTDNVGFLVELPNRKSFIGPRSGGKFLTGAPVLAVEVRSEGDYGARADQRLAAKRSDYFAAGTLVVLDVDVLQAGEIRVYRAGALDKPTVYGRGEVAEVGPALPGWTIAVDDLFV
jgi:Uma2 family endonuclease